MTDELIDSPKTERLESQFFSLWPEIAAILLVLMEISWVSPWYQALSEVSYVPPALRTFLVFSGVMFASYLAARLSELLRLINQIMYAALLIVLAGSFWLCGSLLLDPEIDSLMQAFTTLNQGGVLLIFATVWLWWRGISLGRGVIEPGAVWRRFWWGLLMLVVYFLVIVRVSGEAGSLINLIIFLFTGMLALVVSRVAYISLYHGSTRNPFDRRWLGLISLSVGGIVSLAGLIASLLTGQFSNLMEGLTTLLRWISVAVIFIFSIPWLILAYLLEPLIPFIRNLMEQSMQVPTPTPTVLTQELLQGTPGPTEYVPPELPSFPAWVVSILFWLLVLGLVLIFVRNVRGRMRRRRVGFQEAESIMEDQDLLSLLRKSARDRMQEIADSLSRLRPSRRQLAVRIRQIYSDLMDLSADIEHPRPEASTPLEFLPELRSVLPDQAGDLNRITYAYIKVRYGEYPESSAEVDEVEAAWRRVEEEGRKLHKLLVTLKENEEREKEREQERGRPRF